MFTTESLTVDPAEAKWRQRKVEQLADFLADAPALTRLDIRGACTIVARAADIRWQDEPDEPTIRQFVHSWNTRSGSPFSPEQEVLLTAYAVSDDTDERIRVHNELVSGLPSEDRNPLTSTNCLLPDRHEEAHKIQAEWEAFCRWRSGQPATSTATKNPALFAEHFDEIEASLEPEGNLVRGVLNQGGTSVAYGEPGSGKSLFFMLLASLIGAGRPLGSRPVQQGLVVYCALEGTQGARKRFAAIRKHYGLHSVRLVLVPCPIDLSGRGIDVQPLLDLIAPIGRPILIVFDTLSRLLAGGNENDSVDMGGAIKNVDRIGNATGAHCMLIHHSGKDREKGARGHSLLRAAVDTEIELLRDRKTGERKIVVRKQRDMDDELVLGFGVEIVEIGQAPDGTPVTAPVAVLRDLRSAADFSAHLTGATKKAWAVFEDLTLNRPTISKAEWREEMMKRHYQGNSANARRAIDRAMKELIDAALIEVETDGQIARVQGVETDETV